MKNIYQVLSSVRNSKTLTCNDSIILHSELIIEVFFALFKCGQIK